MNSQYDLVVIGSGPAGKQASIHAAKLGKKVLIIERDRLGGSCLHTATIPSKTLREMAIEMYGRDLSVLSTVMARKNKVISAEEMVFREQLTRNQVRFIQGTAAFVSPHEVVIQKRDGNERASGKHIIIATGARPLRPSDVPFNTTSVFDSGSLLDIETLPKQMLVLGAGVIGCEYASIFAALGARVVLADGRDSLLRSVDPEILEHLQTRFKNNNIEVRLRTQIGALKVVQENGQERVQATLDGKQQMFDAVLYAMGREGNVDHLNLEAAGLKANDKHLLDVNAVFQTSVPHIYAVGDVIGSPALAAASAEQGRIASSHIYKSGPTEFPQTFPFGIYTIPEISWIGAREVDLFESGVEFVVGRAHYKEIARGRILDDEAGMLKMVIDKKTRQLLGVHVVGTGATEIIHIGQVAMGLGAKVDYFITNVFNYPTLAEAYKVAAYNAYNQLR